MFGAPLGGLADPYVGNLRTGIAAVEYRHGQELASTSGLDGIPVKEAVLGILDIIEKHEDICCRHPLKKRQPWQVSRLDNAHQPARLCVIHQWFSSAMRTSVNARPMPHPAQARHKAR